MAWFDPLRKQWFTVLYHTFPHGPVPLFQVTTDQQWGPETVGSQYTDFYYDASHDVFSTVICDADRGWRCEQVTSTSLRDDGQSFLDLEWTCLTTDEVARWGNLCYCEREKNGRRHKYYMLQSQWQSAKYEEQNYQGQYCQGQYYQRQYYQGGGGSGCCVVM